MDHPPSIRMTAIQFADGARAVAPTDQWIAWIIDVLHPMQREQLLANVQAAHEAQQNQPRIAVPPSLLMGN